MWSAPFILTTSSVTFYGLAASGTTVHAATGDGKLKYRRSFDDGATWPEPYRVIQSGTSMYPEIPIASAGSVVAITGYRTLRGIVDWCTACGPRQVGNLWVYVSGDNGDTFVGRQITTDQSAFRGAVAIDGSRIGVCWMNWRGPTSPGTWDVQFSESLDGGQTFSAPLTVAPGIDQYGANRPSLAPVSDGWVVAWMAHMTVGGQPSPCFVASVRRRVAGEWLAPQVVGPTPPPQTQRPGLAVAPGVLLLGTDMLFADTEQALFRSLDDGASWGPPQMLSAHVGVDGHGVLVTQGSAAYLAWIQSTATPGVNQIPFRSSLDAGVTWAPEETMFAVGGGIPAVAATAGWVHGSVVVKQVGLVYVRRPAPTS